MSKYFPMLRRAALTMLLFASGLLSVRPAAAVFDGCEAPTAPVTAGAVTCRRIDAGDTLGGTTAFSYFAPPACTVQARCPTLYLLHGFGGDYTTMLGTKDAPSSWVQALTKGPSIDPSSVLDPWTLSPDTWVGKDALDFVLVAPHGRTLAKPGGFGPAEGIDLFWADWNPRAAAGGDAEAYATPPPRFETFFTKTLIPYVEATLPVGSGRDWRAIDGVSLGGYGAYKTGLQHPDLFASIGSVSGSHNILVAPGLDPVQAPYDAQLSPPVALPYTPLPSLGSHVPVASLPSQLQGFAAAFLVFGDPSFDQAWFRGNQPRDLTMNARAWSQDVPALHLRAFNNDAAPRRQQDFGASYPVAQAFEALVLAMNAETQLAFADQGVTFAEYAVHPGLHSGAYWDPFLRQQLREHYAHVRHADGAGAPPPSPTQFDFRSISPDFSVWGWRFQAERPTVEFLNLRRVNCRGVTVQGTGKVTITVPAACGTSYLGATTFTIDLGNSYATDEQAGASALPAYGRSMTLALT